MTKLLKIITEIYNHFHNSNSCFEYISKKKNYPAYYTSMYLLQDTGESLLEHRTIGFNKSSHLAYIEFWGVMQAIIIQQDSIKELYEVIFGEKTFLKVGDDSKWRYVRNIRNICAGHPANRGNRKNIQRSFMGRCFGDYSCIRYETCADGDSYPTHPTFNLNELLNEYENEAAEFLNTILTEMKNRWPLNNI